MKTFENQKYLPPLPVPKLLETLDRYLESGNTSKSLVVDRYKLQKIKIGLAFFIRNFCQLDEWWYDGYLENRLPLMPFSNIVASDIRRFLLLIVLSNKKKYFKDEFYYIFLMNRGKLWDMHQYYVLFNSTRLPRTNKDQMQRLFCLEAEGTCPSHVVVLCRGTIWKLETFHNGRLITPEHFYNQLNYIQQNSIQNVHSVVSLTSEKRDIWAQHTNVDAIVAFDVIGTASANALKSLWNTKVAFSGLDITALKNCGSSVAVKVIRFTLFGNLRFRASKIYGDTIVQMALQLAYYLTHHSFAPTYETASTRAFYRGRTETVRSCTSELTTFVHSFAKKPNDNMRLFFWKAYHKHNQLMNAAMSGQGCDRHLYGLKKALDVMNKTLKSKIVIPELYVDKGWTASGGNNNFLLSTSFSGYDVKGPIGYVTPMCEDGYGAFYKIGPQE
ncbi:unnamed protein product [Enterobius vermicularis]|uniref:Carn_acyltransf domain-containing protein n=1 Tax=Enterobius vermicularis TaxID=51028 RepID=A0A0N4VAT9_ENTVE|nr:unnamed protein product [Enterobius vermicularis]